MPASQPRVSERIVESVAVYRDADVTALPPLYGYVDPDALDALFETPDDGESAPVETVQFVYDGAQVTVHRDGSVDVDGADAPRSARSSTSDSDEDEARS